MNKLACLLVLYGSILICKGQPAPTPEGNLQVVKRYYQLVSTRQFEQLAEVITADALLVKPESLPYRGQYQGVAGWTKLFGHTTSLFDFSIVGQPQFLASENAVTVLLTLKMVSRKNGKTLQMPLSEIFLLQQGKIAELKPFYFDTARLLEIL